MNLEVLKDAEWLAEYEEAVGMLKAIKEAGSAVVLDFEGFSVALPLNAEIKKLIEKLEQMVGKRIAILRTDLLNKPYLVREVK